MSDAPAPHRPTPFELWLYGRTITKLELARRWTKDDGSDETTIITFTDVDAKENSSLALDFATLIVDFRPQYGSVCRLNERKSEQCRAWVDFTRTHADKLAQFEKLKAELGL